MSKLDFDSLLKKAIFHWFLISLVLSFSPGPVNYIKINLFRKNDEFIRNKKPVDTNKIRKLINLFVFIDFIIFNFDICSVFCFIVIRKTNYCRKKNKTLVLKVKNGICLYAICYVLLLKALFQKKSST